MPIESTSAVSLRLVRHAGLAQEETLISTLGPGCANRCYVNPTPTFEVIPLVPADPRPDNQAMTTVAHILCWIDDDGAAWLVNHCRELACHLNQVTLPPEQRAALHIGDSITFGVTEIEVISTAAQETTPDARTVVQPDAPPGHGGELDDSTLIDLADLALTDDQNMGKQSLRLAAMPASLPVGQEASQDPLDRLRYEYQRALDFRAVAASHEVLDAAMQTRQQLAPPPADPFQSSANHIGRGSLLTDLLNSEHNIALILQSMDSFGADQLLRQEEHHEVLQLLAPQRDMARAPTLAATLARQEHHRMSVDSYLPEFEIQDQNSYANHDDRQSSRHRLDPGTDAGKISERPIL